MSRMMLSQKASVKPSKTSREIDRAVSRIYEVYGRDLSAFLSSVKQKRERAESPVRRKSSKAK
jgi:hypothetical protein